MAVLKIYNLALGQDVAFAGQVLDGSTVYKVQGDNAFGDTVGGGLKCPGEQISRYAFLTPNTSTDQAAKLDMITHTDVSRIGVMLHSTGAVGPSSYYIPGQGWRVIRTDTDPAQGVGPVSAPLSAGIHAFVYGTRFNTDTSEHEFTCYLDGVLIATFSSPNAYVDHYPVLEMQYIPAGEEGTHPTLLTLADTVGDLGIGEPPAEALFPVPDIKNFRHPCAFDESDDGTTIQTPYTSNPLRFKFTNSTYASIDVYTTLLDTLGLAAGDYPIMGWKIRTDNVVMKGEAQITEGMELMMIATGLSLEKTYEIDYYVKTLLSTPEHFIGGYDAPYQVRLGPNIHMSEGAELLTATRRPRLVVQDGDSTTLPYGIGGEPTEQMLADAEKGWVVRGAEAEDIDIALIGQGSTGYGFGAGTVPSIATRWKYITEGRLRNFTGVDEYRVNLGRNDEYFGSTPDATVAAVMEQLVEDMRTDEDVDAPSDMIIRFQKPFGGGKAAIIESTANAIAETDENVIYTDYGDAAAVSVSEETATDEDKRYGSFDGVHLDDTGHERMAAITSARHGGEVSIVYREARNAAL